MARLEAHDPAPSALSRCVRHALCLLLLIPHPPVLADIDVAEYETRSSVRSEKERKRLQSEFERARAQESAREQLRQAEAAQRAAEHQARLAARPYPVRLAEARCTMCHAATHYTAQRHAWIGWLFVVLRMKYLNQAPMEPAEIPVIASHLSEQHGAGGVEAALEYALVPAALALPLLAVWLGRRGLAWRRRRR